MIIGASGARGCAEAGLIVYAGRSGIFPDPGTENFYPSLQCVRNFCGH
jgi:hypothetical protein